MKRGQASVVGFLVITLIIIVVVGGTFFWGKSMIERNNDFSDISRMENRMREVHKAIKEVANDHGQRSISLEIKKGKMFLEDSRTLTYSADMNIPEAKFSGKSVLIGNGSQSSPCYNRTIYYSGPMTYHLNPGTLGIDDPGCLIESGKIDLKLRYILLDDPDTDQCYSILLESGGSIAMSEGTHNMIIRYDRTEDEGSGVNPDCTNLITKVVKIDMS
jgi:hypothetical protein